MNEFEEGKGCPKEFLRISEFLDPELTTEVHVGASWSDEGRAGTKQACVIYEEKGV